MTNQQKKILWLGRFDRNYSRNRLLRRSLNELVYRLIDFMPKVFVGLPFNTGFR